ANREPYSRRLRPHTATSAFHSRRRYHVLSISATIVLSTRDLWSLGWAPLSHRNIIMVIKYAESSEPLSSRRRHNMTSDILLTAEVECDTPRIARAASTRHGVHLGGHRHRLSGAAHASCRHGSAAIDAFSAETGRGCCRSRRISDGVAGARDHVW